MYWGLKRSRNHGFQCQLRHQISESTLNVLSNFSKLPAACASVRWRGFIDLLPKFIATSGYLKAGIVLLSVVISTAWFSAYRATTSLTMCIQLWGILQNILTQTIQECLVSNCNHWANGPLSTTRNISSGSANSTFELKWLRKSCHFLELRG